MVDDPIDESSMRVTETPVEAGPAEVATDGLEPMEPPTLGGAFFMLCEAMLPLLEDDLPEQLHVEQIMGFYANGNHAVAWTHAVLILEKVIGVPLRGMT